VGGSSTTGSAWSLDNSSRTDAVNRGSRISFLMLAIVVLVKSLELFLLLFISRNIDTNPKQNLSGTAHKVPMRIGDD
jgi:hypothetical protein